MDARAVSKRLAYVLRHDPASVGIVLDEGGWVDVDELLAGLAAHGLRLSPERLDRVVGTSDKARYVVSGGRIRAAHGHSVPVDLGLTPGAQSRRLATLLSDEGNEIVLFDVMTDEHLRTIGGFLARPRLRPQHLNSLRWARL